MILQKKDSPKITYKNFLNYSQRNPDGFGLMYINNEKLVIFKTMEREKLWRKYIKIYSDFNKTSVIGIHFRLGTGGKTNIENCHPFKVNDNIAMMHNGVFSMVTSTPDYSDTYIFNKDICTPLGNDILENKSTQFFLKDAIGNSNKVIFISSKGEYIIFNEDMGEWKDNIWYSFKTYESHYPIPLNSRVETLSSLNSQYNSRVEVLRCEKCKRVFGIDYLYTIINPYDYKRYICFNCLDKDTKVSEITTILEKSFIGNRKRY